MARGCTTVRCEPGRSRGRSWYDVRNDAFDSRGDRALVTTRGNRGVRRRRGVLGVAARRSASTVAGAIPNVHRRVRRWRRPAAVDALSGREVPRLDAARSGFATVGRRDAAARGRALLAPSGRRSIGAGTRRVADLRRAGAAPGRLDHHHAARPHSLRYPLLHAGWQTGSDRARAAARALLHQAGDPGGVSQLVPYGGNLEGAAAASLIYFGKDPSQLTLSEAVTLAVLPQNPTRRAPGAGARPGVLLRAAQAVLYARWQATHPRVEGEADLMKLAIRIGSPGELPFRAPHLVNAVLADAGGASEVHSTLDRRLQALLERHIRSYVAAQARLGVHNAAAMLVDSRSMDVKALVGSADFLNRDIAGQVNGTRAKRSPGSTLKPFIYALGLDQGVLHPMTMLKDAPSAFGAYSPENFDGRFVGPLTAKDALIRSRNVPAVYVAAQLSQPDLYGFLEMAGVSGLRSREYYGLALVLGGGSLTMEELVSLYGALANRGVVRPVRYRDGQGAPAGVRLLSAEASYVTLNMLKDNPRPGDVSAATPGPLPVYWKTGTSYGFRDAWTIGMFGPYILAVWVGNFDGSGNPAFVGVQVAAPLFFRVVDAIDAVEPSLAEPVRDRKS